MRATTKKWMGGYSQAAAQSFGLGTSSSIYHIQLNIQTVFLAVSTRTMEPTPPTAKAFSCH